jgi:4,5-DOPA dioxygenase extradiol
MVPSLFVSHGSPTLIQDDCEARSFLAGLGAQLGRPSAVICASAHWDSFNPAFTGALQPSTIHDFHGFPPELYRISYAAPGSAELAAEAASLVAGEGLRTEVDPVRGIDHGAWVPLKLMYPDADVPVIQLSVQSLRNAEHHRAIGEALRPLREKGVLVMGSGGATHNLRELDWNDMNAAPREHVANFEEWLVSAVIEGRVADLTDWKKRAPKPERIHPTPEHFLPLFVPLGAGSEPKGRVLHRSFTFGALSMAAFAWD